VLSDDKTQMAWVINEEGYAKLKTVGHDSEQGTAAAQARWHQSAASPSMDLTRVVFTFDGPANPGLLALGFPRQEARTVDTRGQCGHRPLGPWCSRNS